MILIPSIELMEGKVVLLEGGRAEGKKVLADDPVQVAMELQKCGALFFHLVDLDAAFGTGSNDAVFEKFAKELVPFQVRGGIRTAERAEELFGLGADRVVLGTLFHQEPQKTKKLIEKFGLRIMGALDVEDGTVKEARWGKDSDISLPDHCKAIVESGVGSLIYTRIDREGKLKEPDIQGAKTVIETAGLDVYGNIGVRTQEQWQELKECDLEGLVGAIVGHSYYGKALEKLGVLAKS